MHLQSKFLFIFRVFVRHLSPLILLQMQAKLNITSQNKSVKIDFQIQITILHFTTKCHNS